MATPNSFSATKIPSVMAEAAMPEVRNLSFRLVEPVVDCDVVVWPSAEFLATDLSMLKWVSHG